MSHPGASNPPCTLQFPQGKAGCDPGGKLSPCTIRRLANTAAAAVQITPRSLPRDCHGGGEPHRSDRRLRGRMSYWGLAARFSPSFPAPRGRVSAGRLPCGFVLVLRVGDQRCHRGGDSGVLCVVPAAQAQQAPHFSLGWRCPQIAAQGRLLPSSSPDVGAQLQQAIDHRYGHMSWAHARCLLQRTRGLRSFESPVDSQHLL